MSDSDVGDRRRHRGGHWNKQWGRQKADRFTARKLEAAGGGPTLKSSGMGHRSLPCAPQQNHSLARILGPSFLRKGGPSMKTLAANLSRPLWAWPMSVVRSSAHCPPMHQTPTTAATKATTESISLKARTLSLIIEIKMHNASAPKKTSTVCTRVYDRDGKAWTTSTRITQV